MTHVKAGRDIARERVVAIERDGTKDPMMMARRLACSNDYRAMHNAFNDAACDLGIVDTLDQDVALCAEPIHGSNLLQGASHRPCLLAAVDKLTIVFWSEEFQDVRDEHNRAWSVATLFEGEAQSFLAVIENSAVARFAIAHHPLTLIVSAHEEVRVGTRARSRCNRTRKAGPVGVHLLKPFGYMRLCASISSSALRILDSKSASNTVAKSDLRLRD
jgi:hypothetical protein